MEKNNFIEIFNDLLSEEGLNRRQFAEKCGIPYTTVIGWTSLNRLPDFTALIKIANFFNCSIDYLAGRQDDFKQTTEQSNVFTREKTLLKYFRALDSENKDLIIKIAHNLKHP
ncbi:MAG: helix-turn-helix domain-containing protein [Clostridia bacterium]|nr:helix-turn-helix domain-containing protein [Clostridia bacterium]